MAEPGQPGWNWFPSLSKDSWSLDVVTLLAVIGESSIQDHAQAITSSAFGWLPRIIPAPQALLKPTRPGRMPSTVAQMTGVHSGTTLESVGFFANAIMDTPLNDHPPYAFKVYRVSYSQQAMEEQIDTEKQAASIKSQRRHPMAVVNNWRAMKNNKCTVLPKFYSPIHILGVLSFLVSFAIVATGIYWQDGNAILSITLISIVSTIVGIASHWQPVLMKRTQKGQVPPGDVMIRTRAGALILIKCNEEIARELYSGTEKCRYLVGENSYRFLMALGTVLLMVSVVLLGNCTWNSQIFIGGSYVLLNGFYWCLGMFPASYFWDLSRYVIEEECGDEMKEDGTSEDDEPVGAEATEPTFTSAMWMAIRETKEIGWVKASGAAPKKEQWDWWLDEAVERARAGDWNWDAVGRMKHLMREASRK